MANSETASIKHLSESELIPLLDHDLLPRHVAIIMDGNGRWAEQRGLPRIAGHREGIGSVRESVTLCRELGVQALTIYAFSQENWKRPQMEISVLMALLGEFLQQERKTLKEQEIQFRSIGRVETLPHAIQVLIREVESETSHLNKMVLSVALSYGGRAEIIDAVKQVVADVEASALEPTFLTEQIFERYLSTHGIPDPDLLIRTSGEARISNFLLWQIAYAELYFTRTLWPDFRRRDLMLAFLDYQKRERRFGRIPRAVYPQSGL